MRELKIFSLVVLLLVAAGFYLPIALEIFAVFQIFVLSIVAIVFLVPSLCLNENNSLGYFDKINTLVDKITEDPDNLNAKTMNKLRNVVSSLDMITDEKTRQKNFLLNVFIIFSYALVYKYFAYVTIAQIVAVFSLVIPTLKTMMFAKLGKFWFNEAIDTKKDINGKIHSILEHRSDV